MKTEQEVQPNGSAQTSDPTAPRKPEGDDPASNKDDLHSLIELLIDLGKQRQEIINQIAVAVRRQNKDEVFNLAKTLVGEA